MADAHVCDGAVGDQATEEETADLEEVFASFDDDGDCTVTTERRTVVLRPGRNPADVEQRNRINDVESDGNDTKGLSEFLSKMLGKMRDAGAEQGPIRCPCGCGGVAR